MTNHIEEARKALSDSDGWNNNAKAHALIAIAEQLQLANRIALKADFDTELYLGVSTMKPEVAELLGVKE